MAARKKTTKNAAKSKKTARKTAKKTAKPRSAAKSTVTKSTVRSSRAKVSATKRSRPASKSKTASKSSKTVSRSRESVTKAKEKAASAANEQIRAKAALKAEGAHRSTKTPTSKVATSASSKPVKTVPQAAEKPTVHAKTITGKTPTPESPISAKPTSSKPISAKPASPKPAQAHTRPASAAVAVAPAPKVDSPVAKEVAPAPKPAVPAKPAAPRPSFKLSEFVVYPAHGVGQIMAVEEQEVAGFRLELYVISFSKDKMTLRVPTSKVAGVGLRRISDTDTARRALEILAGRARVKRTMWSRRAQEYESKINSGDIGAIAEVIRDLYRSEAQPEQSYSERQLYEAALDRLVREIAAVQKLNEIDALKSVEAHLQKGHGRSKSAPPSANEPGDAEIEEAA
jgi:CarD family transcriptional regulator